jgi:hypothetical protein
MLHMICRYCNDGYILGFEVILANRSSGRDSPSAANHLKTWGESFSPLEANLDGSSVEDMKLSLMKLISRHMKLEVDRSLSGPKFIGSFKADNHGFSI